MKDTKQHILDIALKLFLQKTFKEVTMKEIVQATGLSKGAFYHYFPSKELLFKEILDVFLTSTMNVKWQSFPQDSLRDFLNFFVEYSKKSFREMMDDKGEEFNLNYFSLFFDGLKLFPDFKASLVEHQKVELAQWVKIVTTAQQKGEIKSIMAPDQIAKIFLYTSDGSMLSMILSRLKVEESMIENLKGIWDGFYSQIKA